MAYTVGDLINIFRREVDDPAYFADANLPQPNTLWSTYQLIQILNEAQEEFAERTLYFKDSLNFAPIVTAGDPLLEINPKILSVEVAELASNNTHLAMVNMDEFHSNAFSDDYGRLRSSSWSTTTGTPRMLITDTDTGFYRLYPIPVEDDSVSLTVRRLPLTQLETSSDDLEVPDRYQLGLLHKLRREAYRQPKAMLQGFGEAAMLAERDWEDFIAKAKSRIMIKTRRPGRVRYGGL